MPAGGRGSRGWFDEHAPGATAPVVRPAAPVPATTTPSAPAPPVTTEPVGPKVAAPALPNDFPQQNAGGYVASPPPPVQSAPGPPTSTNSAPYAGVVTNAQQAQLAIATAAAKFPPGGFDVKKWNDPTFHDPKYDVGRLVAQFGGNVQAALPAIQQLFPGATLVGDDKIDFGSATIKGQPLGTVDVRTGAGAAWWNPVTPGAAGYQAPSLVAASQATAGGGAAPGASLTMAGGGAAPGQTTIPDTSTSLLTPWTQTLNLPGFDQPTMADLTADPGFMSRIKLGQDAIQASAAARGTLNSTGTEKTLSDYTSQQASDEYQNLWGRRFATYQQTLGNLTNEYNSAYGAFRDNQKSAYDMLSGVAGLGANVATGQGSQALSTSGQYGGIVTGSAAAQGDAAMQGANATAAGAVGSANAWNGAIGNLTNLGQTLYLSNLFKPQSNG